jgi:hypothetical protein
MPWSVSFQNVEASLRKAECRKAVGKDDLSLLSGNIGLVRGA